MSQTNPDGPKFTGKHMLGIMISFYAVIIIVNLVLVYFASQSWTGLLTKNSYAENQVFDKKTSHIEKIHQQGPQLVPVYKENKISLNVNPADQNREFGNLTHAVIGRVVHERDDSVVQFIRKSDQLYEANHPLSPGRWQLKITIELPSGALFKKSYILLVRNNS